MNQEANIDFYLNNQDLLISLCQSVIDNLGKKNDLSNAETNEIQLREISKAIAKLEKKGVDVPDSLRAEKTKLAALSHNMNNETQALLNLLNRLEQVVKQAKLKCNNGILPSGNTKGSGTNIIYKTDNEFYKKITDYVISFEGIEIKESKSMITYFCYSEQRRKNTGLVWLCYPRKRDHVKVYLRKETNDIKYPKNIIDKITKYKKYGWGKYPLLVVASQDDCDNAIALIKFANENL